MEPDHSRYPGTQSNNRMITWEEELRVLLDLPSAELLSREVLRTTERTRREPREGKSK